MSEFAASLGQTFFAEIWNLFDILVPGFDFTIRQLWIAVALCSLSLWVIRQIFGGSSGGDAPRTSSTDRPKISRERRHDEF